MPDSRDSEPNLERHMRLTTKIMAASAAFVLATATMAPQTHAAPLPTAAVVASVHAVPLAATTVVVAALQDAKIEITTNDRSSRGAWYTQPVWIAIGIIALVLIIALIAMAGRRGNTTVVK
jgi:hypothetical protein